MGAPSQPPGPPPPDTQANAGASAPAQPAPFAAPPPGGQTRPQSGSAQGPAAYPPGIPPPAAYPPGPPPGAPVMMTLSPAPIPGMVIRPPRVPPQLGQVLVGYEICQPHAGCCRCDGLSPGGLMAVILLVLFFWPLAWVPCVMPECFDQYQRPVYGFPSPMSGVPPQQIPAGYPPAPIH